MSEPGAKKRPVLLWIVGALLLGGICVCGGGLAIGVPAYQRFIARSKLAEAQANVRQIHTNVAAYAAEFQRLPASIPPTPAEVPCGAQAPWPAGAPTGWAEIGFAPYDAVRYRYALDVDPNGTDFTVRAEGDLDCDGETSSITLRGQLDPATGEVTREGDLVVERELE